jgi:broad specificity phosphatase PhoE
VNVEQSRPGRERFDSLEWTATARSLLQRSNDILPGLPAYLFLRHSHRRSPKTGPVSKTMPITALGRDMANEFGYRLSTVISRYCMLYHSPLIRCKQTAEAIQDGLQQGSNNVQIMGVMEELVNVSGNMSKIMEYQEKFSYDWVNYWLLGFFPAQDIESPTHYGWRVCSKMTQLPVLDTEQLVILVGHDDTLLALRGVVAGIPVDASWLSYLGGFWLQFAPDAIFYSDATHSSRKSPYPSWWRHEEKTSCK